MSIQLTVMSLDFDSSATPMTKVYEKDEITLGRLPGNDLVLDKPEVSGYHARLRVSDVDSSEPTLLVKDLGSSNGTMVENNSLRAQVEIEVQPNQRIIIGNYLIKPTVAGESSSSMSIVEETFEQEDRAESTSGSALDGEQTVATQIFNFTSLGEESVEPRAEGDLEAVPGFQGADSADEWITAEAPEVISESPTTEVRLSEFEASDSSITIEVSGRDVGVDFSAIELLTLEGVLLHKGQPLEGVAIEAGPLGSCVTDAEGKYSFAQVLEGTEFSVTARKQGFEFDLPGVTTAGSSATVIEIQAVELFDLRGRIEHHGAPLAGVSVQGGALGEQNTDANGCFRFENLRDGTSYQVKFHKEGFLFDTDTFSGTVAEFLSDIAATARQLFRITGVVKHHETPLAGVIVDGGPELGTTETDENGQYVFENVPEDAKYTLSVRKDDFKFNAISK